METELIRADHITRLASRLERAAMKIKRKSFTRGTIANAANPYIVEILDSGVLQIKKGWREALKLKAESV